MTSVGNARTTKKERTTAPSTALATKTASTLVKTRTYGRTAAVLATFTNLMKGDPTKARQYVETVMTVVARDERLQYCAPRNIFNEAARAAALGLSVEPALQQAYLVPDENNHVTMVVDYRGLVQLSENTGAYAEAPYVSEVWEGEMVNRNRLTGEVTITGTPDGTGRIQGWMAHFKTIQAVERWEYMSNSDCDMWAMKYNPKGYFQEAGAWQNEPDKMRRKTVLRALMRKWGKFSPYAEVILGLAPAQEDNWQDTMPPESIIDLEPRETTAERRQHINNELGFQ
jgi:phage RecT family recombinase